jgi:methylmalonyl-CoA/ethylmalonyl-CoA epimerase
LKLHHVGFVVKNIQESLGEIKKYIDFETIGKPEFIGTHKVNVCFLKLENINLEFIEPADEQSPISDFLKQKSGGFHHICFEVVDIKKEIKKYEQKGARIIIEPKIGFENRLTAFVYLNLKNTECNLIELAEEK